MSLAAGDPRHGTRNGYNNHGCRCPECRKAAAVGRREYKALWRRRRGVLARPEYLASIGQRPGGTHGLITTYNRGCRCDACRAAGRQYRARMRRQAKERAAS